MPSSAARCRAARDRPATRDGPSRLTSTAVSRGESKLTAAAEWITMSHSESSCDPVVVEAEPVGGHVAGHRGDPGGHLVVEPVAVLLAQAVEAVVLQDLPGGPLHRGRPPTGADEQDHPGVGNGAEEPFDQGRSQEPGGTGDEELLAARAVTDAGHRICLPYGK